MSDALKETPLTFVVGLPRSATSWLGQILGSHPDHAYLNEPDVVLKGEYPHTSDEEHPEAREHIESLIELRHPRAAGHRPVLPKSYRGPIAHRTRQAIIYGLKACERFIPALQDTSIPALCDMHGVPRVIKSVSMLGRARAWNAAVPHAKWVLILRHPCGHAHSTRRGQASGLLPGNIPLGFEECPVAAKYDITRERLEKMTEAERLAWRWAILNENAMDCLEDVHTVSHDVLAADPIGESKKLFKELEIPWHSQVETFLSSSTAKDGSYFRPTRIPLKAANSWRESFEEQDEVLNAIAETRAMQLFR
jgi:hypothetical protein